MKLFQREPRMVCPRCGHKVKVSVIAKREAEHRAFWSRLPLEEGIPPLSEAMDSCYTELSGASCAICGSRYHPEKKHLPLLSQQELEAKIAEGSIA